MLFMTLMKSPSSANSPTTDVGLNLLAVLFYFFISTKTIVIGSIKLKQTETTQEVILRYDGVDDLGLQQQVDHPE